MLSLDSATLNSVHYTVLLWMPYYFSKLNFGSYNILVTAAYVVSLPIGSSVFGFINKKSLLKTKYLITAFLFMACSFFFILIFLEGTI